MTKKPGGYQSLIVYQQAVVIYDLTLLFCQKYLADQGKGLPTRRTQDQMIQAARSGKQNIVEASLEKSTKLNINLNAVSRASFGELLEDFKDFLRSSDLKLWEKDDPRVLEIRAIRISPNWTNLTNKTNANLSNWTHWTNSPEAFCNLMITLISRENYLLDQLVRALETKFIQEGGYSENLFKKRLAQRKLDQ